jgi:predicted transcriptional regulator
MTVKEEAIRAISSLPDDAQIDDVMYRLYVIDKVTRGQTALKEGRTITTDELLKEIESW